MEFAGKRSRVQEPLPDFISEDRKHMRMHVDGVLLAERGDLICRRKERGVQPQSRRAEKEVRI